MQIVENIITTIKDTGLIFFDVRGEGSLKGTKYKERYNDGYVVGKGSVKTFQKEYQVTDILEFLKSLGLNIIRVNKNNSNINLICSL